MPPNFNSIQSLKAEGNARIHVGNYVYSSDSRCLGELRNTDPRLDKRRIEEGKGPLISEVCRWALDSQIFQQWCCDPSIYYLWINGERGRGKTMLLCGIIDELERSGIGLPVYFFCQRYDDRLNSAMAVLRGLLFMLMTQRPSLLPHLHRAYDVAGSQLFSDVNSWIALSEVLEHVLLDESLGTTYFIVDAIDECTTGLTKLLQLVSKTSTTSKHRKWIISSHKGALAAGVLLDNSRSSLLTLELNQDTMMNAFKYYVRHRVEVLARKHRYDAKTKETVEQYFLGNPDVSLLWVSLVCDRLSNGPIDMKSYGSSIQRTCYRGSTDGDMIESRVSLLERLESIGQSEWNRLGHRQPLTHHSTNTKYNIFPISMSDVTNFIHRCEMDKIDQHFEAVEREHKSSSLVLYGMGGSGKTQLAMHYCRKARDSKDFGGVLWIDAASIDTVNKSMLEAAQVIFTADVRRWEADQTRVAVFRIIMASRLPWLLVLDNVDNPRAYDIESILPPQQSRLLVIITSRSKETRRLASPIEVTSLREDEALKLLIGTDCPTGDTCESALRVVRRLGCLALAVAQAGAYISDRNMDLDHFLNQYELEQKKIHSSVPSTWRYQRRQFNGECALVETTLSIASTWELSLDSLSGDTEMRTAKTQLLVVSAFFGRNTITEDLISTYVKSTKVEDRPLWVAAFTASEGSFDSYTLQEAIAEMGRLCLLQFCGIDSRGASWGFHPVVQDWAMYRTGDGSSQALLAAEIVQHQLGQYQPTWVLATIDSGTDHRSHTALRPHVIACYTNCEKLLPLSQSLGTVGTAMITLRFASFFQSDGQYELSENLLNRIIDKHEPGSREYCLAIRQLAETMCSQGKWREASELQEKVMSYSTANGEDLEFAFMLAELAYIYQYQASQPETFPDHDDRMNKGLELASRSYAIITTLKGDNSVAASASMWLLSAIAYHKKDFEMAKEFGQRVVDIREKTFGNQNLSTVAAKENLAVFLAKLGQGAEAACIHLENQSVLAAAYGPNHPKTLEAERMLARAWRLSGQFEKAQQLGTEILDKALGQFGLDHHDTERAANGLWRTLIAAGDFVEAARTQKKYGLKFSDADNDLLRKAMDKARSQCLSRQDSPDDQETCKPTPEQL